MVDALLGTGVSRPIGGALAGLLAAVRQSIVQRAEQKGRPHSDMPRLPTRQTNTAQRWPCSRWLTSISCTSHLLPQTRLPQIVAVDCPSGLNCDTGALDPAALPADLTVTFANPKIGHFALDGPAACGRLEIADIGTNPDLANDVTLELATPALAQRPAAGASRRRTQGHLRQGAGGGRVSALHRRGASGVRGCLPRRRRAGHRGVVPSIHPILAAGWPKATWLLLPEQTARLVRRRCKCYSTELPGYAALLVGPGLSTSGQRQFVNELLRTGDQRPAATFPCWSGRRCAQRAGADRQLARIAAGQHDPDPASR